MSSIKQKERAKKKAKILVKAIDNKSVKNIDGKKERLFSVGKD